MKRHEYPILFALIALAVVAFVAGVWGMVR